MLNRAALGLGVKRYYTSRVYDTGGSSHELAFSIPNKGMWLADSGGPIFAGDCYNQGCSVLVSVQSEADLVH